MSPDPYLSEAVGKGSGCARLALCIGLAHAVPPNNTKFKPLLFPTKFAMSTQTLTNTEHHISSLLFHLWVQLSSESAFRQSEKKKEILAISSSSISESAAALSM